MHLAVKLLLTPILVGIPLFCVFGFLCIFEPLPFSVQLTWRIIYAGVGALCLVALIAIWRTKPARHAGQAVTRRPAG